MISTTPFPIDLQPRDLAVLRDLFESRIMTLNHVAALHFDGRQEAAKKRLQKLKAAHLIAERRKRVNEPSVLFLSAKAFPVLKERGVLALYPRAFLPVLTKRAEVADSTIAHELEVMDVKAALSSAIRKTASFSVAEFSTWPALNQFKASRQSDGAEVIVRPDAFIRIHEKENAGEISEHTFFMELDRSTETQDILALRAACYMDYYRTGGFAMRNGADRSELKDFPFRVLVVCKNEERRNNAALRMANLRPPIFTQVWLTTYDEVIADPLGLIWTRPVDCQRAVSGTLFDRETAPRFYRTEPERERLISSKLRRLGLLTVS